VPTVTETTQVYKVFVKATPEAIWDAITNPDQIDRYGYRGRVVVDLRAGGSYRAYASPEMLAMGTPEVMVEGEVIEAEAPHKLVQTWHPAGRHDGQRIGPGPGWRLGLRPQRSQVAARDRLVDLRLLRTRSLCSAAGSP
jgi:uncharacterized protein YndB with AHSA1/START domain